MNCIMLSEQTIHKINQTANQRFCNQSGDNITVHVGYGREVIKTFDDTIVYHHYPTAVNPNNNVIILGRSNDRPEMIINRYLYTVAKHQIEEQNQQEMQLANTLQSVTIINN